MFKFGPAAPQTSAAVRYGLSIISVALALLLTLLMQLQLDTLFFLAIILSAWFGGTGPGQLAVLLSTLALEYLILDPKFDLAVSPEKIAHLIVFLVTALLVSSWSVARRRAEDALRQGRDELEAKIMERTADLSSSNEQLRFEIAERERVEAALNEKASLLNLTHDTIFVRDINDTITYWNRGAEERYGWTSEEAVGKVSHQLMQTIFPEPLERLNEELLRRGRWEGELIHTKRDATQLVVASRWSLQLNERGRPTAILETNNDITERKRAEEQNQAHLWFLASMDRVNRAILGTDDLKQMMSDVLDAVLSIFECDRAWLVYPCDPEAVSWRAVMEHTRTDFPGAFALGVDLPMDSEVSEVFKAARASGGAVQFGPGSEHPVPAQLVEDFSIRSLIGMAVRPKVDKPYMFGLHQCSYPRIWTPQEERLLLEIGRRMGDALTSLLMFKNLRQSEARLEEAQRMSHVGYWDRDLDKDHISCSEETYCIFGLAPEEGPISFSRHEELIHSEDYQRVTAALAEALRGGPSYDVEYRVVRPNGDVRIVHSKGDVTIDASGRPRRIFGTIQDITEGRRAEEALRTRTEELRQAQTELAHVNRVMTMGELTASIAHEVNQPLAGAITNADAALRWLDSRPPNLQEAREAIGSIINDGHRASEVITRIRALVKKSAPAMARLDLSETIQEALVITNSEARRHRVSVRTALAAGLPPVRGDRVQLQQVMLNLAMNSIDAMEAAADGPRELLIRSRPDKSGTVLVAVQDSGIGLDPQSMERLFEPFYTTKPGGMGMGLRISWSIIEAHGGRLWATPNAGPGITVQFTLPIIDEGTS